MKNFLLGLLIISGFTANAQCIDPDLIDPLAICPLIFAPVCGCDGKTYSNSCVAQASAGVTSWVDGECTTGGGCIDPSLIDPDAICIGVFAPVCGCDGITYSNSCWAQVTGGNTSWTDGECEGGGGCVDQSLINPDVICPAVIDPVCGCDSITYNNACEAFNWYGVMLWTEGPCEPVNEDCIDPDLIDPDVVCADFFEPVCGCDSMLYQNDCVAMFHYGVTSVTSGPCDSTTVCIDQDQIDLTMACPDIWDPVCGCDSITYGNSCDAFFYAGIQSWTPGECDIPDAIWQVEGMTLNVSPNPFRDQFVLSLDEQTEGNLTVLDLAGREIAAVRVYPGRNTVDLGSTPSGVYMLYLTDESGFVMTSKVVKQ
jgi:hypothetical protein